MFISKDSTKTISSLAIGALGLALTSFSNAETFDDRWYIAPALSYIIPDSDRDAENGFGFNFGIGKSIAKYWNIELNGIHDSMDADTGGNDYTQTGVFIDGLFVVNREAKFSPYAVLGAGALNTEIGNDSEINPAAHAGVGFIYELNTQGAGIRSDIRYRMDFDDRIQDNDNLGDFVVNLGLYIPLGEKHKKAVAAAVLVPAVMKSEPKVVITDSDNDGIPDAKDNCSNTPSNAKIDAFGCELDNDGDKVADSKDQCDKTPANVSVNALGCPIDSDNDGVADYQDQCKDNLPGAVVNAMGCEPDADGDGIADIRDACPNSITTKNTGLDGCSLNEIVKTQKFGFEKSSAKLSESAKMVLTGMAERLNAHPKEQIEIVGYTDSVGPDWFNNKLSEERAKTIKQFLVGQGVNETRLITKGDGPSHPIADNDTDQGRAKNRRVEMFVMD